MPQSPRHHHTDRLHAVAMTGNHTVRPDITVVPKNCTVLLLLHRQDHAATSPTTSNVVTVAAVPKNRVVRSAVTATRSTPSSRHRR
jgi:hypothetical protein